MYVRTMGMDVPLVLYSATYVHTHIHMYNMWCVRGAGGDNPPDRPGLSGSSGFSQKEEKRSTNKWEAQEKENETE